MVRLRRQDLAAEELEPVLLRERREEAGVRSLRIADPGFPAGSEVGREERGDGGGVALLVEDVGAEDQVERTHARRLAPVCDEEFEFRGRERLLERARLNDLECARLPVQERDVRAALRGGEPADTEAAAEVEDALLVETRAVQHARD